jgi:vacuolar-type H+-ATPase catalytic subunit A/Vma1
MTLLRLREEAKTTAGRMAKVIEDQINEGGFHNSMMDFIDDFVTYLKAEYLDAVYLQQDAFHEVDAATSAEPISRGCRITPPRPCQRMKKRTQYR